MILLINLLGALITFLFGVWAIFKPKQVAKFISVTPYKARGITEIRATYGGWMCGLSGFALWSQSPEVFYCLGFGWLGAAALRGVSFYLDKSYSTTNLRFVIAEIIVGIMLLF